MSSFGNDFNYDFQVSFTKDQIRQGRIEYNFGTITGDPRYLSEELPGVSVFALPTAVDDPSASVWVKLGP